jgi:Domain of unknown function (DUF4136)
MSFKTLLIAFITFIFITACSSLDITSDYDSTRDFSKYKTYRWAKSKEQNKGDLLAKNIRLWKKIQIAVDKTLKEKGFEKLDKGNPDFIIFIYAGVQQRVNVYHQGGYYYGGWWGPHGGYTTVSRYNQGTLVIDIVDRKEKELSWRGMASDVVRNYSDPKELQEEIDYVVSAMLYEFPPN